MWLSIATLDKREQSRRNKILKNASGASGGSEDISSPPLTANNNNNNNNNLTDLDNTGTNHLATTKHNSTSSNETVIERLDTTTREASAAGDEDRRAPDADVDGPSQGNKSRTLKSLIVNLGQHLNLFNHHHSNNQTATSTSSTNHRHDQDRPTTTRKTSDSSNNNFLVSFAQRCFHLKFSSGPAATQVAPGGGRECHSCPVTPLKTSGASEPDSQRPHANGLDSGGPPSHRKSNGKKRAASQLREPPPLPPQAPECEALKKPSVRFVVESPPREHSLADADTECVQDGSRPARNGEGQLEPDSRATARKQKTPSERSANSKQRYFTINKHLKFNNKHARQVKFTDCAVQTGGGLQQQQQKQSEFIEDDAERAKFVEQLFSMVDLNGREATENESEQDVAELQEQPARELQIHEQKQKPMDSGQFRAYGYRLIDYICNYLDTIRQRRVTPINIEPGYLKSLIQPAAPEQGESFPRIMRDFEEHIMCGITHWQHPHFHAYFPAGNAYPSILADMLSDALGCVGFSWAASPAYTELEIIMLDWMGKMIGLPDEFLCLSSGSTGGGVADDKGGGPAVSVDADIANSATSAGKSRGGGVIQGSASECVLVNMLAARHWAMDKLRKRHPGVQDGILLTKLIGYCSKEAHSCVEKAAMIGFINMRALETDEKHSLRGETLRKAIEADLASGLEPFIVCATLGTTSCVSFDNLKELGAVCRDHDNLWLHVDAAYAGSALICPEFKYLIEGIELATSFNMNPNKWMLINFDCSLMWVKDRFKLTRAFVVDPLYLQHSFSDQAIDYRHWGIPLSRRFRALKLWFTIRNYGIEGLREYIRNHVQLAKLFESLIRQDKRFTITNEVILGLVCFRLIGSNALNQRLLSMLNASGKLHMVPASLNGRYIIRFCVCDQNARPEDIHYAYECISQMATELFELIKAGKERIRAISQQNTIDVSSISLHTQQSASADLVGAGGELAQPNQQVVATAVAAAAAGPAPDGKLQPLRRGDSSQQQHTSQELDVGGASNQLGGARSPAKLLTKQVSVRDVQSQQQPARPVSGTSSQANLEDLEQEVPIDGSELELDLDADEDEEELDAEILEGLDEDSMLEALGEDGPSAHTDGSALGQTAEEQARMREQLRSILNDSISPIQRGRLSRASGSMRSNSTLRSQAHHQAQTQDEADEAADELVKLADKRNRMSLRYKREFFVRVVSDPRVYRASISGDINAHAASTSSLGSSGGGVGANPPKATNSEQAAESCETKKVKEKKI